jgi:LPS export ABC transporter protein LptC
MMARRSFIALGLSIWLAACSDNDLPKVEDVIKAGETPTEVSTHVDLVYTDSAKLKAQLKARRMIRYLSNTEPKIEMPLGLNVNFFDDHGNINSRLRADYGIRYTNKNLTKVTGDVNVVNLKGDTLYTEELFWQEDKERIYSNKFVKVRTKDEIILAEGFESDIKFEDYTFTKVRGILSVKE